MLREWREWVDDVVVAPDGMVTLDGKVRRRTWRCETRPSRQYDLTVYLGVDQDDFLIVMWECEVSSMERRTDRMSSRCALYGWKPAPVTGARFAREAAMRTMTPLEVTGYTAWGSVLPGIRK